MNQQVDLTGQSAIVTGGSRNIGLAIASKLQKSGARVSIVAHSDQKTLNTALETLKNPSLPPCIGNLVDITDEKEVFDLFELTEISHGPTTILVNGAAIRPHLPFVELNKATWSKVIDTILTGAFLTSREFFRRLPETLCGSIINIGGMSAHIPQKDRAHVIAAKSGLLGLTRALAVEGQGRIRVNSVVPGVINTSRQPSQYDPIEDETEGSPIGTTDDVAQAVLALSNPDETYITGQTIHVNGGRFMP